MIHYHGLPISPETAALSAIRGGHAFLSKRYPAQLRIVLGVCQSFALDNAAFSAWKEGKPIIDWSEYYAWVAELSRFPSFDFAVIPEIFTRLPLSSADSTNIARNIGIDSAWTGTYQPPTKEVRALVMRERIESRQSSHIFIAGPIQKGLF